MKSEKNERRFAPRAKAFLHLHIVYEDLDQLIESYSRDISEGGIYIETDDPLPVGSKIQLKISIVHQELMYIDALGEVVHFAEKNGAEPAKGMGVRFVEISPESRDFIREFVLSRMDEKEVQQPAKKAARKKTQKKTITPKKK